MMEYYYETEEILIGCNGNSLHAYVNTFSKRAGFGTAQTIDKAINKTSGRIERGFFVYKI